MQLKREDLYLRTAPPWRLAASARELIEAKAEARTARASITKLKKLYGIKKPGYTVDIGSMSWRLTIRLFGNQPNGKRDPVTYIHVLADLGDVAHSWWTGRAARVRWCMFSSSHGRAGSSNSMSRLRTG